jgi:hypothetical protein
MKTSSHQTQFHIYYGRHQGYTDVGNYGQELIQTPDIVAKIEETMDSEYRISEIFPFGAERN